MKNRHSIKCGPRIYFMPSHDKILDICLRSKELIPDIYQELPVYTNLKRKLSSLLCDYRLILCIQLCINEE